MEGGRACVEGVPACGGGGGRPHVCRAPHRQRRASAARTHLPTPSSPQALRRFGTFRRIRLDPPLPVEGLVTAALEAQEALGLWADSPETGTKAEVAALLLQLLRQKAGLLEESFGIAIDAGTGAGSWAVAALRCLHMAHRGAGAAPRRGTQRLPPPTLPCSRLPGVAAAAG